MPDRLYEALVYKAHGMHPIPFYPHSKTPAFEEGQIYQYRERVPSVAELKRWFQGTDRNIGLITGVNGLHILDVDGDVGHQNLKRLPALPPTPTLITGRGEQYYFHGNEELPSMPNLLPGIDFLSNDFQALTASSIHPDGPVYHFAEGRRLSDLERAPLPAWISTLLDLDEVTAPEAANPIAHTSRQVSTTLSPTLVHSPQQRRPPKSRYLPSGAPVLLDTVPHVSGCNHSDVRGLFGDFAANQWVASYLRLPRLGRKFLCFYHPERRPSMTLYVDKHTGAWKVHDWHERGISVCYGLADIFASRIIGHEVRLEGKPTLTVWWLRLLITSGYLEPADVPAKPLPPNVRPSVRTLYDGFILNFQGRWLYEPGKPMPYTEGFAMAWCGLKSKRQVEEGLYWLRRHGYMRSAGHQNGSQVFLPGEGA
jgi:Bifunctional DNA primase/polymerase, N-terminal